MFMTNHICHRKRQQPMLYEYRYGKGHDTKWDTNIFRQLQYSSLCCMSTNTDTVWTHNMDMDMDTNTIFLCPCNKGNSKMKCGIDIFVGSPQSTIVLHIFTILQRKDLRGLVIFIHDISYFIMHSILPSFNQRLIKQHCIITLPV